MKLTVQLLFFVLALVCFIIKGLSVPTGRLDFMNLGFACIMAGLIFG